MEPAATLLNDAFDRVRELFVSVTEELDPADAAWQPVAGANHINWLLWHCARVQDDHISELAQADQAWNEFYSQFGLDLDFSDTGFGHKPEQVAMVNPPLSDLRDYHHAVHTLTKEYVGSVTGAELDRIIDTQWQPAVSAGTRLISVNGDCLQHLGQAAYIRGLAEKSH